MKVKYLLCVFVMTFAVFIMGNLGTVQRSDWPVSRNAERCRTIEGVVCKGETLFDIFKRYNLEVAQLFKLREASATIHRLRDLAPGQPYRILLDEANQVNAFSYWIDDDSILSITRTESGFSAERKAVEYEKRILHKGGVIAETLIESMGAERENLALALQLSDIFAWDMDFATDIRKGDTFRIVVEGLCLEGEFKKYGNILSAEFVNNGERYRAYRFEHHGKADYYDDSGTPLKRAFLKAPLSFRRISSGFSKQHFHPILKIYRPHHGVDYAAPTGTPVSAIGGGTVTFAGYKGHYGRLIVVQHPNGWKTWYGHLSGCGKDIRRCAAVAQGQIIGYVGSTGLATGPHLHFELRMGNTSVDPLTVRFRRGEPVQHRLRAEFIRIKDAMDAWLVAVASPVLALAGGGQ